MLGIGKSKLDRLVNRKAQLNIKISEIRDNQNKENSIIETKMKTLQDLSFRNKDKADNQIAEVTRQLKKVSKLINIEIDYAQELIGKGDKNE